jgi:hypothetical protein
MNMQRPPAYELTEAVWTTAPAPTDINPVTPAIDHNRYNGPFGTPLNPARYHQVLQNFTAPLQIEYQAKTAQIPLTIETDLAATRLEESMHALPPAAAIARELGVRNKVIQRKAAEQHRQTALSHGFYGSDPTDKTVYQFLSRAQILDKVLSPNGPGMNLWKQSYRAAMEARLLTQTLAVLHQQQVNVHNWLAAVQANDQAQAEAAEAARRAAEQARVDAEQQRQKDLAETARRQREQEEIHAREQARLEALAQKQRLDAEQARLAAETARINAQAQEEARIAAFEIARAKAEAAEQARVQTEMEKHLEAQQTQDHQPPEIQHVYPASGATASINPVFSFTSTAIRLAPAASAGILNALRTGLLTVKAAGAALISGPVLVGFAALLTPSRLGNGERFSMSVPLTELSPESPQTLREIADRQGTLEMPVGLGVRRLGAGAEVFVATSDDFHIRSSVLVLNAAYNLLNDIYEVALPDSPTDFLTWTPAIAPVDSSTESPMVDTDSLAYTGAPIVPIEGRLDLHPVLIEGWERFIIVFPDDSGIAPLYVVFSSPYGGVEDGEHSGRDFNPEETGLPVTSSDWAPSIIAKNGINIVRLHTSKFPDSDANKIMIDRLERVFRGELEVTDTDKRFYTHEIREFERLKALGYGDTEMPDKDSSVWNNVHTATLEDYKLKDDPTLLYTPEALEAARRQEEREYQKLLKEMW